MDKLDMQSRNLVDENINKIAQLFPNCITEGKDENGQVVKSIMTNEMIPVIVEVPNTSKNDLPIIPISIIFSVLGLGLIVYGKKKN